MRKRVSLIAVVIAGVWAASALASSPAQIYNDYVRTHKLSCSYNRGDLEAFLRSGSINQYGDPLTLTRLKLAARQHLAGSCQKASASNTTAGGASSTSAKAQKKSKHRSQSEQSTSKEGKKAQRLAAGKKASTGGDNSSFIAGRGLIIGLLAVALAFGGWLTKRALGARD